MPICVAHSTGGKLALQGTWGSLPVVVLHATPPVVLVLLGAAAALDNGVKLKVPGAAAALAGAGSKGAEPEAAAEEAPRTWDEIGGNGTLAIADGCGNSGGREGSGQGLFPAAPSLPKTLAAGAEVAAGVASGCDVFVPHLCAAGGDWPFAV